MSRRPISFIRAIAACMSGFVSLLAASSAWSINNAPADAAVVNLRINCTEGGVEVSNCFTTMDNVDDWLVNVRQAGPTKPTLVEIGPGTFGGWTCKNSHVTLRGSGRDQTELSSVGGNQGLFIDDGCTNLNVQDLTINGSQAAVYGGVVLKRLDAITTWTNVEIIGSRYAWIEDSLGGCQSHAGRHSFFSSRITAIGGGIGSTTIAYWATCAASWFWGSEITASPIAGNTARVRALTAVEAEIHLYGSNARLLLPSGVAFGPSSGIQSGTALMTATGGSAVHIHGTGLDIIHDGSGTVDMLSADAASHFHANESGFNIHVTGTGKVNRVIGAGVVEAPYIWGAGATAPLSASLSGVQTLASRNGMDSYIETDCPLATNQDCSAGAGLAAGSQYPRLMVYRKECTGTTVDQGPWFDTVKRACRN